jgi:hypothetical protein
MALESVFREALDEFLARELTLVRKKAHEQSLCGRLAIYMDRAKDRHGFEQYFVDVEYNRRGEGRKQILHPVTHEHINVVCDVLLHSRGDRLIRAFEEPADLIVVQHCNRIENTVVRTTEGLAYDPRRPRRYCIINGNDTAQILKTYGRLQTS